MLRKYGPVLLIPAAWTLAVLSVPFNFMGAQPVFIAHIVMDVALLLFVGLSRQEMSDDPVLRTWRNVIAAGFIFTLIGTAGFILDGLSQYLFVASLGYWMVTPSLALIQTGLISEEFGKLYRVSGLLSLLGSISGLLGILFLDSQVWTLSGLAAVGIGQTLGIVIAAYHNTE